MRASWSEASLALSLLLVVVGCFEARETEGQGPKSAAPTFDLPLLNGNPIRLAEMRGKIVILDFWATWCAPCEVQLPVLDTLWQDDEGRAANGDDLMIVGISVDTDPASAVSDWIAERGFVYPIALGDQDLAMRYGVIGFPTLVIVDPDGGVYTRHTGVWSRPENESVLEQIRGDRPTTS